MSHAPKCLRRNVACQNIERRNVARQNVERQNVTRRNVVAS